MKDIFIGDTLQEESLASVISIVSFRTATISRTFSIVACGLT
jgi:hypothetical protein